MTDASEASDGVASDAVFDRLVARDRDGLADYQTAWIQDPEAEADRWGGRWSDVAPVLRRLSLLRCDDVTRADRLALESIQSGTPWPRPDGGRGQLARRLYDHVARTGSGEAIFRMGPDALDHFAYPDDWRAWVPSWAAERFVGIGSPWVIEPLGEPRSILDLGCGAGVDVHVAHQRHPHATIVGCDRSASLLSGPAGWPASASRLIGDATATPLGTGRFDLIVANGLPPALGTAMLGSVASECRRLLRTGGELRFTCLVVGPDQPLDELDPIDLFNALRVGKPVLPAVRAVLADAGLGVRAVHPGPSPFSEGFRAASVHAVTLSAVRQDQP